MARIPLVSIIIPTHNRSDLLMRAVQSVFRQSIKDVELIIVADACQDDTAEKINALQDDRIRLVESSQNVGGGQARNIGLDLANGQYIAFLDDDDEWLPKKLEKQLPAFDDSDVALVGCAHYAVGQQKRLIKEAAVLSLQQCLHNNLPGSFTFCMFRKKDLHSLRIDPLLVSCQDWDLWIKLLSHTGGKCRIVQEPLALFYQHQQGRISDRTPRRLEGYLRFLDLHKDKLNKQLIAYHQYYLRLEALRVYSFSFFKKINIICTGIFHLSQTSNAFNRRNLILLIGKLRWKNSFPPDTTLEALLNWPLKKQ